MAKMSIRTGSQIIAAGRTMIGGTLRAPGEIVIVGDAPGQISAEVAEKLVTTGAATFGIAAEKIEDGESAPQSFS